MQLNSEFWCSVVCSWVYARKWAPYLQGPQLSIISGILSAAAWVTMLSPIAVLIAWGLRLIILLDHDTVGLAVIMAGTAALLAFYAIMLWWRTQWQSSRMPHSYIPTCVLARLFCLCWQVSSSLFLSEMFF